MEKFLEYLQESEKIVRTVDHMVYITFPLIKDKKLLIKIIMEIKKAVASCINSILQYEYIFKKINLSKDSRFNFKTFIEKSAPEYKISPEEIKQILNLFEIVERHKQSNFEFMRNEKIIILSENMRQEYVNLERIKEFLSLSKSILKKTKERIIPNF